MSNKMYVSGWNNIPVCRGERRAVHFLIVKEYLVWFCQLFHLGQGKKHCGEAESWHLHKRRCNQPFWVAWQQSCINAIEDWFSLRVRCNGMLLCGGILRVGVGVWWHCLTFFLKKIRRTYQNKNQVKKQRTESTKRGKC